MNSSTIIASVNGPAWPPCFSSIASVRQPASNSAFHASLKPARHVDLAVHERAALVVAGAG